MPDGPAAGPNHRGRLVPVLGGGLLAAVLAAWAGSRAWVRLQGAGGGHLDPLGLAAEAGESPLALGLALVVLACWGVALVTRRVVRRAVLVLAAVASVALVATVVVAWSTLPGQVRESVSIPLDGADPTTTTPWYWAAALASVACLATTVLAVLWCPTWPEMGSRYEAPGTDDRDASPEVPLEEQTNLDLWKQLDEGRDPTA